MFHNQVILMMVYFPKVFLLQLFLHNQRNEFTGLFFRRVTATSLNMSNHRYTLPSNNNYVARQKFISQNFIFHQHAWFKPTLLCTK